MQSSVTLDSHLIDFVKTNLKDEKLIQKKPFNNLTINDIDTQKISIQAFSKTFFELFEQIYFQRANSGVLQNFNKTFGVTSFDQMKPQSREILFTLLRDNAQKTCVIALEKFNSGAPFGSVIGSAFIEKNAPLFSTGDFTGLKCGSKQMSEEQAKLYYRLDRNKERLANRKRENQRQSFISDVIKAGEEWKSIMQVTAFYFSKECKDAKILKERSEDHLIENYASFVEQFKVYELKKKTEASEAAFKTLCLEETCKENQNKKTVKSFQTTEGSNKTQQTNQTSHPVKPTVPQIKKNPTVDPKTRERNQLNVALNSKATCPVTLHSRIRRWDVQEVARIKDFIDTEDGVLVKKYEHMNQNELLQQLICHNIGGIISILAHPKVTDKYSFTYNSRSNTSDDCITRCFYAEMEHKGKSQSGIIRLGIGKNNVIFHALFTPINGDRRPEISELFASTKNVEELNKNEEGEWSQISPCTFELLENDMLVMKVKTQAVKFIFHPLLA